MFDDVSVLALAVVFGMSAATYTTKAGGFWILDRLEPSDSLREGLDALPGGIIVAMLTVRLLDSGPSEWMAGIAVVLVAHRTENVLLAMAAGVGTLLVVRGGRAGTV
ncbi:AzlD domain-containing protein [Natrinema sp. 1APR25-10V2]|uniref:AzlD family protein n=1 Tax=Natrinema sp. 1APR25-10V2 TaxID=2951081 RepID=UPI0028764D21|nr:AzlD domain-containing protein [Natrinema sp. 1APR25-10V2]MDS0477221.1 AzlD domain-containing protein [Natrinema sp. 1APR25-10V2]